MRPAHSSIGFPLRAEPLPPTSRELSRRLGSIGAAPRAQAPRPFHGTRADAGAAATARAQAVHVFTTPRTAIGVPLRLAPPCSFG